MEFMKLFLSGMYPVIEARAESTSLTRGVDRLEVSFVRCTKRNGEVHLGT